MKDVDLKELEDALTRAERILGNEGYYNTPLSEFHKQVRAMLQFVTNERIREERREEDRVKKE